MEYSQKYTLVAPLESLSVGYGFSMADWPPHVTLADVFAIELDSSVKQQLRDLIAQQPTIKLSAGNDATLGTAKVVLINKHTLLQNLHNKIIDLLDIHGAQFNTPEFTRQGFLPHSTIQKFGRLKFGDEFAITSIALIDMFPEDDWQQRRVLDTYQLKET